MKASRFCLIAVLCMMSAVSSIAWAEICDSCGETGVRYGFTPYGFRHVAPNSFGGQYFVPQPEQCPPYEQSLIQYSPIRYSSNPCDQWQYRGCFLHLFPVWAYTPTLIPPMPHSDFCCCYNCGICCDETPCCPLCNMNGCCERENAIDSGEPLPGEAALSPKPAKVPATPVAKPEIPTTSTEAPATTNNDATSGSDDVPAESATPGTEINSLLDSAANNNSSKIMQTSWKNSTEEGVPSNRLSNIDVRSSRGAVFNIWAPNQAKVYINGYETKSVGSKRTFASVNLKPGLKYQYTIDAVVEKDGKSYSERKTVVVSAGSVETVAFSFPELNTIPSDEWDY